VEPEELRHFGGGHHRGPGPTHVVVALTGQVGLPEDAEGAEERYDGKQWEVVYKGKWIVGTDYIYDFGLATNMKRAMDIKKISKTELSFHVVAASFDKMVAKGITEDLIPIADEIQMTVLKLRNLNNRMIPTAQRHTFKG
jgi:hypothetical protein